GYTQFRGKIHAPAAHAEASQRSILTIAERFETRIVTPGEITLTLVTSASCVSCPTLDTAGAYSVVFTEMSPNTDDHGKQAEMA
ncbi:hypothetical protein OFC04_25720, partial [Escherichia coli]|nr:hypothetical protein [Escherichia coli]